MVARNWYEQAANLNVPVAMINLGVLAQEAGDRDAARAWWEQAANLNDPQAMFNLGVLAQQAGDRDAARAWYEQAATLDEPQAMINLGLLSDEAGDEAPARDWYEKAAALGNTRVMNMLGRRAYEAGDLDAARAWYEQAANLDHPQAMFNLGVLAQEAEDRDAARAWYEQAATLDDPDAMFNLGRSPKRRGIGMPHALGGSRPPHSKMRIRRATSAGECWRRFGTRGRRLVCRACWLESAVGDRHDTMTPCAAFAGTREQKNRGGGGRVPFRLTPLRAHHHAQTRCRRKRRSSNRLSPPTSLHVFSG